MGLHPKAAFGSLSFDHAVQIIANIGQARDPAHHYWNQSKWSCQIAAAMIIRQNS